jgi:hypothetical protein
MKTLKSFYEGQLQTEEISLDRLVPFVTKPENKAFYTKLKEEVESDNGMRHPILVVPLSPDKVEEMIKHTLNQGLKRVVSHLPLDDTILVIVKGNNRFYLAKELGYSKIECVVTQLNDMVGVARANKVLKEYDKNERTDRQRISSE